MDDDRRVADKQPPPQQCARGIVNAPQCSNYFYVVTNVLPQQCNRDISHCCKFSPTLSL